MRRAIVIGDRSIRIEGRIVRIARIEGEDYRFVRDPGRLIDELRSCGKRIDVFTFLQQLPETTPQFPYPMEWDNAAVLSIKSFDDWWTRVLGFKGRNKAKQAEKKGVVLREIPFDDRLVDGIWRIYNETPVRQGKRFPHYGMLRNRVREHAGTFLDCSVFLGAFLGDELIGFAKLTINETHTQAGLMHILSMVGHREKAPTNALVAQAVRSCAARNIPYLVYSQFAYGNKQRDSLSDFKERNGFQRVDIPRYYVALNPLGKLALRAGMHHRLIDRVPESVISRFRSYRAAWYRHQYPTSNES